MENDNHPEQAVPDSPPVAATPKAPTKSKKKYKVRSANLVSCHIVLLDGTIYDTKVDKRSTGQVLFDDVCSHLDILEKNYFGLSFKDSGNNKQWLVDDKKIVKQLKGGAWAFDFELKFYPVEPVQMHEDLTRYLLCLQVRIDILNEKLPCSFTTQALLGSYAVQSELGDYSPEEHGNDIEYIRDFQFIKNQDDELLNKISELHREHKGLTPAQADLKFLESAKKLMFYGVESHDAKDWEGLDISIGICARGVLIFQGRKQINRFAWPKVLKISYRRCSFILKIRPGEFERFEATVFFKCENSKLTKRLWKSAIEQHTFFRWKEPLIPKKNKIFKLGSKHRYSGRTQFQTRQEAITEDRPNPQFERAASKRSSFGSRSASMNDMHFTRRNNDMYRPIEKRSAEAPSAFKFNGVPGQEKSKYERDDNVRRYKVIDVDDDKNNVDIQESQVIIKRSETETKYKGVPTPLAALNEADKRRTRRVSENSEDDGPISRSTPVKLTPPTIRRYSLSDDDDIPDKISMEREEKPKEKEEHKNGISDRGPGKKEKDKKNKEKEEVKKAQLVTEVDL